MLIVTVAEPVTRDGVRLRSEADAHPSDAEAFRALIDRELDVSYRLAAAILRDRDHAEDAVHDAALAAWRSWSSVRDPDHVSAWFQRIVVNVCRDRLRRARRRLLLDSIWPLSDSAHPTHDSTSAIADQEAVRAAIGRLSADDQVLVALRFVEDMTVPSIAALLAVPEGTIKSRLSRATSRLRAMLQSET